MKPTAVLVNVARAEIVDEDALYEALRRGAIAGAILDVWYRYPTGAGPTLPSRLPFHELGNVLMTPHVSGWTEGMLEARAGVIAENIRRAARGEAPLNLVANGPLVAGREAPQAWRSRRRAAASLMTLSFSYASSRSIGFWTEGAKPQSG
jgi:phosphoglycerate dehydrogenase-like enzyme